MLNQFWIPRQLPVMPRRRETVLDRFPGSGPVERETLAPTTVGREAESPSKTNGKTDWFSLFAKLMPLIIGGLAGGKAGLRAGTQFSTGFIGEQEKQRKEQALVRKESLAEAKQTEQERHAKELERLAQAKIDAAEAAASAKEEAAEAKADAKEKARIKEKNVDLLKDLNLKGDTEGVNWLVNTDPNDPQGFLTPRSRVEQKPGQMTPRTRAEIDRLKREQRPITTSQKVPDATSRTGYRWMQFNADTGLFDIRGNEAPPPPGAAAADAVKEFEAPPSDTTKTSVIPRTVSARDSLAVKPAVPPKVEKPVVSPAALTAEETTELADLIAEAKANGGALSPEKAVRFNELRTKKLGK